MLAINLFHLFKLRLQVLLEGFAADDALGPRELWCELSVRLSVKAKGHEYKRFTNKGHSWREPPEPDGTGGGTGEEPSDLLEQKQADKDEGCGPLGDLLHRLPSGMRP